jgi:FtsP/CotA-like multicopper oxidase with cupredoxin domain
LADVVATDSTPKLANKMPTAVTHITLKRFVDLSNQQPATHRNLYFSEQVAGDGSTKFFITVKGQPPRLYDPDEPPAIVTRQGRVEDWTIENHSTEVHAFHLHQLHFIVLEENGQPTHDPALRDTVVMPYWDGISAYPHITVRVDFRDPETVGTFLYHCHILDHEDGGMMAKIRVLPAK